MAGLHSSNEEDTLVLFICLCKLIHHSLNLPGAWTQENKHKERTGVKAAQSGEEYCPLNH